MPEQRKPKRIPAIFYRTAGGREPAREWLKSLPRTDRQIVGFDLARIEYAWPVGMPVCRPITSRRGLWEVCSDLPGGRIVRLLFCIHKGRAVVLHGFIKKTQPTPDADLDLAMKRKQELDQ
jgi:phage-related protein